MYAPLSRSTIKGGSRKINDRIYVAEGTAEGQTPKRVKSSPVHAKKKGQKWKKKNLDAKINKTNGRRIWEANKSSQ